MAAVHLEPVHTYSLQHKAAPGTQKETKTKSAALSSSGTPEDLQQDAGLIIILAPSSMLPRSAGSKRAACIRFNSRASVFVCQAGKVLDAWRVRPPAEFSKKVAKKLRKLQQSRSSLDDALVGGDQLDLISALVPAAEVFEPLVGLKLASKITSFAFSPVGTLDSDTLAVVLGDNQVSFYSFARVVSSETKDSSGEALAKVVSTFTHINDISLAGHRSGIRAVALSSDDALVASTSNTQVKIWNTSSYQCIRTLDSGFGLCCLFTPGDQYVVAGTKTGHVQMWHVASGDIVQTFQAHEGSVWGMDACPDKTGIITCGSDKQAKIWNYSVVKTETGGTAVSRLALTLSRSLKVTDDIMCVKFSPDGRVVALGLLDNTIQLFHADSLNFHLSLYGHSLPVLSIDISSDSTLLVSGSADKSIKIWGMDFGDLHKSLFAHADSVMQVRFVPNTHHVLSVGKDKLMKFWDADRFEHIMTLEAHCGPVWALALNSVGSTAYSAGADRSVRVWQQGDRQIFLEEERERELEKTFEMKGQVELKSIGRREGVTLQAQAESGPVALATGGKESIKAGDRLIEAIELARSEVSRVQKHAASLKLEEEMLASIPEAMRNERERLEPLIPNPYLVGQTPDQSLFRVLSQISSAHLEEALMVLPFKHASVLITFLNRFVNENWGVELCVRVLLFLLELHQSQIVANQALVGALAVALKQMRPALQRFKNELGYNIAALESLQRHMVSNTSVNFFGDATVPRGIDSAEAKQPAKDILFDSNGSDDRKRSREEKAGKKGDKGKGKGKRGGSSVKEGSKLKKRKT